MRVLVLHNATLFKGGGEVAVEEETRILKEASVSVECHIRKNSELGFKNKLKLLAFPTFSNDAFLAVRNAIDRFNPHLVHIHNFSPQWTLAAFEASIALNVPVVHTMHTYGLVCPSNLMLSSRGKICEDCVGSPKMFSIFKRCKTSSLGIKFVNARSLSSRLAKSIINHDLFTVITLTPLARNLLIRDGVRSDNVLVKQHSTPSNSMLHVSIAKEKMKNILFVGRLSYEKGIDGIINEFRKIRHLGMHLKIIGDGPLKGKLQKLTESLGLKSQVTFMGHQSRQACDREYSSSMCLLVNPLSYEGFGLVVIEAFSAGLPVIASDVGAMRLLIRDGYNGFLVNPNQGNFAERIETLFNHPSLFTQMAKNAMQTYQELYTPEKNLDRLLKCYRYAFEKGGLPIPERLSMVSALSPSDNPYAAHDMSR